MVYEDVEIVQNAAVWDRGQSGGRSESARVNA